MKERKLYMEMASFIDAWHRCIETENEYASIHEENIKNLVGCLPHGSGLDSEWEFDFDRSSGEKLVLHMSYHSMDEYGGYDGWINFQVIITGSLQFGFNMNITGNFGKKQDIKDYLYDILNAAFDQMVPA